VIFKPTDTLMQETEPGLHHPEHGGNVPTFAAGPRLFQLEKEASYRPDLHPGFPTLIHGKDLKKRIKPVPTQTYLPDWHKAFKKSAGGRKPGYYDLALGVKGQGLPSQELTDAYIRHLMTEGFKRGGAVRMADGGAVTDTLDKMVKNPQASTLLNLDLPNLIAAKQQVRAMKRGGKVEFSNNIDDMRYALTRR
jgi:hypothetical protein